MSEYLETLPVNGSEEGNLEDESLRVLDLGMGNGHMLFALKDDGWHAEMVGVDYSWKSIELARQIQGKRLEEAEEDDSRADIVFEQFDILQDAPGQWLGDGFDIVLDKGTFDAISLNHDVDEEGKKGFEKYGGKLEKLLKTDGYLLITSCNWTEEEVKKWFESPALAYYGKIRYASYTFGGVKGQTVSSVCFKKRSSKQS